MSRDSNYKPREEIAEIVFREIEAAAVAGTRCPTKDELYLVCGQSAQFGIQQLCEDRRILVYVGGMNWRTVKILTGPNRGRWTRHNGSQVWRVVGRGGQRRLRDDERWSEVPN